MRSADSLIAQLTQTYRKLELTAAREAATLSEFEQEFDGARNPEQDELAQVLRSIQAMATSLAEFVKALRDFLGDGNAVAVLRESPLNCREVGKVEVRHLLRPYLAMVDQDSKLREQGVARSYLWRATLGLYTWFAYLGASYTASSSMISGLQMITEKLESESMESFDWEPYRSVVLKKEHIQQLYDISDRAAFLITATAEQLEADEVSRWCQRLDNVLERMGRALDYQLESLIEECPIPVTDSIIQRLHQVSANEAISESVREQARLKLKAAA